MLLERAALLEHQATADSSSGEEAEARGWPGGKETSSGDS